MNRLPRPSFVIAAPSQASFLARKRSASTNWCYLGVSIQQRESIGRYFAVEHRVTVANELEIVAHDCRQPFLDWVGRLGRLQENAESWWASTLASRAPFQSDFFLLLCYAELVKRWAHRGRDADLIIFIEDPWLRTTLARALQGNNFLEVVAPPRFELIKDEIWWLARAPVCLASVMMRAFAAFVLSATLPRPTLSPDVKAILIQTWIEASNLSKDGTLRDQFTGRLEDILTAHGESVLRFTHWYVPLRLIWRLRRITKPVIFGPHFLRIIDIISAGTSLLTIDNADGAGQLLDMNMEFLLRREVLRERGNTAFPLNRIAYRCARAMAARWGSKTKSNLFVYENHPWEKMLCLAWRQAASGVRLVGYQHASVPPLMLNYFLGAGESDVMPLPHRVIANGRFPAELLRRGGYSHDTILNGGAFRYEYFYKPPLRSAPARRAAGNKKVLVAFPVSKPHAFALFFDLLKELKDPLICTSDASPAQFILKSHPDLPLKKLYARSAQQRPWIQFSDQPLPALLQDVDALLYAPPTTSWCEGVMAGIPVLKYQTDLLDIDFSSEFNGDGPILCDRTNLRNLLGEALKNPRPKALSPERMKYFFDAVNETLWLDTLR